MIPTGKAKEDCLRGMTCLVQGDRADALADLDSALAATLGRPKAHNNRGGTRHALGDEVGAIADHDKPPQHGPWQATAAAMRTEARCATLSEITKAPSPTTMMR